MHTGTKMPSKQSYVTPLLHAEAFVSPQTRKRWREEAAGRQGPSVFPQPIHTWGAVRASRELRSRQAADFVDTLESCGRLNPFTMATVIHSDTSACAPVFNPLVFPPVTAGVLAVERRQRSDPGSSHAWTSWRRSNPTWRELAGLHSFLNTAA